MERVKNFFSKLLQPDTTSTFPSELYERPRADLTTPSPPPSDLAPPPVWRGQSWGAREDRASPFAGGDFPHQGDDMVFRSLFQIMEGLMSDDDAIFRGGFGGFEGPAQAPPVSPRDSMLDKSVPPLPPSGAPEPLTSPRDAFLRQDTDLDASPDALLREPFGFTDEQGQVIPHGDSAGPSKGPLGQWGGLRCPWGQHGHHELWDAPSGFSSSSTKVSIVFKPDGSVEETRTVRDHTGREETTVTTREAGTAEGGDAVRQFEGHFGGFGSMFGPFLR